MNIPECLGGSSSNLTEAAFPLEACERRFCYNTINQKAINRVQTSINASSHYLQQQVHDAITTIITHDTACCFSTQGLTEVLRSSEIMYVISDTLQIQLSTSTQLSYQYTTHRPLAIHCSCSSNSLVLFIITLREKGLACLTWQPDAPPWNNVLNLMVQTSW